VDQPAPHPPKTVATRRPQGPRPGVAPGVLVADPNAPKPVISVMAYGPDGVAESEIAHVNEVAAHVGRWPVTWVDVVGLGDADVLAALGEQFGLHPLALEDVMNVYQRPKVEAYPGYYFTIVRMPRPDTENASEQISMFVGPNYVLTFQESAGGGFEPVRQRIRAPERPIRGKGADYLGYALVDAVVDAYFPILEQFGEQLEDLQDEIMVTPDTGTLTRVYDAKHALSHLRRAIWPMREAINAMIRDPLPGMTEDTRLYLRDCYDHAILAMEVTESYRDMSSELMDFYLSSVSNRTNEIMKVLTIIGAIFIPLTFIAGIYGMNFNPDISKLNMPELNWTMGYPMALGLMAAIALGMIWFFRRKGWLG
jgi:magnesium transporter